MTAQRTTTNSDTENTVKLAGIALIVTPLVFVIGSIGGEPIRTAWPPETSVDLVLYSLEIAPVIPLALGVTALVVVVPSFRRGLAGYFATAFLWLGVLSVVLTFRDVAMDVMVSQAQQTDLVAAGGRWWVYEAAHINVLLFGAGVAFLGLAVTRTLFTRHVVGYAGVVLGSLLVLTTYLRFVFFGARWAEPFPVLLLTFVWLFALGILVYRHAPVATATAGSVSVPEPDDGDEGAVHD